MNDVVSRRGAMPQWRQRADQLQTDLRMLFDGVRGVTPAPYFDRAGSRFDGWPKPTRQTGLVPRRVRVEAVTRPTADAVTLTLRDERRAPIRVVPGQFFTFEFEIDGRRHRRAYSACHDCRQTDTFSVTVKRLSGGRGVVSSYVHGRVRVGDILEVFGPSGSFTAEPTAAQSRHLLLVGGGSGITPLMAITRTLLASDPKVHIGLVYGNRSRSDVIFADELERLVAEFPSRLVVDHVLECDDDGWACARGRLDAKVLAARLDALEARTPSFLEFGLQAYLCGPEAMMSEARSALIDRGVAPACIHEERFSSPPMRRDDDGNGLPGPQSVTANLGGESVSFETRAGETLLEAGLRSGLALPYSCAMGGCAACRVSLRSGEVVEDTPNCLSAEERAAGYVLACACRPRTAVSFEVPK